MLRFFEARLMLQSQSEIIDCLEVVARKLLVKSLPDVLQVTRCPRERQQLYSGWRIRYLPSSAHRHTSSIAPGHYLYSRYFVDLNARAHLGMQRNDSLQVFMVHEPRSLRETFFF